MKIYKPNYCNVIIIPQQISLLTISKIVRLDPMLQAAAMHCIRRQ